MSHRNNRRSRKSGLPPGALVHIGEQRAGDARISLTVYDAGNLRESAAATVAECLAPRAPGTVTWINVDAVHDLALLEALGRGFGLHPLTLEDIANTEQRPKLEDHGAYLYLVARMLVREADGGLAAEQVSLILGEDFVLSFQEHGKPGDPFDPVRTRLKSGAGLLRGQGADFLAYSLLDALVDRYFGVVEAYGDDLEDLEEAVIGRPTARMLADLHQRKRSLLTLRRAVWPLREALAALSRSESKLVRHATRSYIADVHDHAIYVIDTVETLRETVMGVQDLYLSTLSLRMNEVIKVLTIIATLFIPLTFVAGWYGMNFKHMPELDWPWAYPALAGLVVLLAGGMLLLFRRRGWL